MDTEPGQNSVLTRLADEYDQETVSAVEEFYNGNALPSGTAEEACSTIKTRLHRIYPERFMETLYDDDNLNHIYTSVKHGSDGRYASLSPDYYRKPYDISDMSEIDAVVLDHCVIGDIIEKRNRETSCPIDAEETGELVQNLSDLPKYGKHYSYWNSGLKLMDRILQVNDSYDADITIMVPEGTERRLLNKPDFDSQQVREVFRYLNNVTEELVLPETARNTPGFSGAIEDKKIAEAAEQANAIIVSADKDYVRMESFFDAPVGTTDIVSQMFRQHYGQ